MKIDTSVIWDILKQQEVDDLEVGKFFHDISDAYFAILRSFLSGRQGQRVAIALELRRMEQEENDLS